MSNPLQGSPVQGAKTEPITFTTESGKELTTNDLRKCFGKSDLKRTCNRIFLFFRERIWVNNKTVKKLLGNLNIEQLEKIETHYSQVMANKANKASGTKKHSVVISKKNKSTTKKTDSLQKFIIAVKSARQEKAQLAASQAKAKQEKAQLAANQCVKENKEAIKNSSVFKNFLVEQGHPDDVLEWIDKEKLELVFGKFEDHLVDLINQDIFSVADNNEFIERNTTNLTPPADIHQQEVYDTLDGKGAMGRVETTSETDKHQKEGPRNDDNVSITMFVGGGSIIVETDGVGKGGMGSAVLSHELNKNINEGLTKNAKKLKSLAEEFSKADQKDKAQQKEKLEIEVKKIATEALSKALESVKSGGSLSKSDESNVATTLSVVMSVPLPDNKTLTFGLQNYDSVSVLWNPSTGKFDDESSFHTNEKSGSQIHLDTSAKKNIEASQFFTNEFEGNRLAIAFSDGVLDNLPGITDPKKDLEKLDVLNDIVRNPAFDSPIDPSKHKPSIVLTANQIKSVGDNSVRSSPEKITPKMVRDRIMNFSVWASSGQRKKQKGTDVFERMFNDAKSSKGPLVKDIYIEYKQEQEIDEKLYKALPKSVQNNSTITKKGKYKFNCDVKVNALALPKDEYTKLGDTFGNMVPSITYPKEDAPNSVIDKLKSDYQQREIEDTSTEIVLFFENKVYECIGIKFDENLLAVAQGNDPGAIKGKTDGVSVVVASIGVKVSV